MFNTSIDPFVPQYLNDFTENYSPYLIIHSHAKNCLDQYPKLETDRTNIPEMCLIPKEDAHRAIREFCANPREAPPSINWIVIDEFRRPYFDMVRHHRSEIEADLLTLEALFTLRPEVMQIPMIEPSDTPSY